MDEDINFLKMVKALMMLSGIWRLPLKKKSLQILYDKYSVIFQCYFYVFVLSMVIEIAIIWNYSMDMVVECLSILILCSIMTIKIALCQTGTIKELFRFILKKEDELKKSFDEEAKHIYVKFQNVTFFISKVVTIHTSTSVSCLFLTKYLLYLDMEKHQTFPNVTLFKKPLPYMTWLPFNSDEHYVSAFTLHLIAGCIGGIYNCATTIFYLTSMIFICGQLKILQHRIKTLDSSMHKPEVEVATKLRSLITDHQTIDAYSKQFNKDVNLILLADFSLYSIQVASLFFQLITADLNLMNLIFLIIYLGQMVLQIFSFSWYANEIKEQSMGVTDAIYEHNWYEQGVSIRKSLLLMMMRGQKPFTLTVGPFYDMTNGTSLTIMKAAYSCVTLMTTKRSCQSFV